MIVLAMIASTGLMWADGNDLSIKNCSIKSEVNDDKEQNTDIIEKPQLQIPKKEPQSSMKCNNESASNYSQQSDNKKAKKQSSHLVDLLVLLGLTALGSLIVYLLLNEAMEVFGKEKEGKNVNQEKANIGKQQEEAKKSGFISKYIVFLNNIYDKILSHKILRYFASIIVIAVLVAVFVFVVIQIIHFICPSILPSLSLSNLGALGDFFGGFIGTFIAALTVIYAIRTYRLERQHQREASVAEMLNTMLELHKQNVSEIKIKNIDPKQNELISGRDAFKQMFDELNGIFDCVKKAIDSIVMQDQEKYEEWSSETRRMQLAHILSFGYFFYSEDSYLITTEGGSELFILCEKIRAEVQKNLKKELKDLQRHRVLGHYYRHLYNMVNYIDKNDFTKNFKKKEEYVKLIRSQLSDYEEILLYYNSLAPLGRPWNLPKNQTEIDKMSLICKYRLLKNCPSYIEYFGIQPWDTYKNEMQIWWNKEGEFFFETDSKDQEGKVMEMLNGN